MEQPNITEPEPEWPRLMTPYEVARILRVERRTVIRWAERADLVSIRTPTGGHRFRESDIRALLNGEQP